MPVTTTRRDGSAAGPQDGVVAAVATDGRRGGVGATDCEEGVESVV